MALPWGTTVMLLASGAHALGASVLLLLNPRSRAVRWFALFLGVLATWFALLAGAVDAPTWVGLLVARAFPAVFLAFALVVHRGDVPWTVLAAAVAAVVAAQWGAQQWSGARHVGDAVRLPVWIVGSVLLWRARPPARRVGARWLHATLAVFAPVMTVAAIVGGDTAMELLLPIATVGLLLVVFVGIVRHRLYEIEVRVARSGGLLTEAAAQDRLAVLGELAASFAHEVRNPLTGVRSLAQRLAEDDVDDVKRRRYAGVIVGEVERVEALVERLLGLARRRAPTAAQERVDVPLAPLLEDIALLVQGRAERAGVTVEVDGAGLAVRGTREALAQVLLNLVINAVAHSPAGGTLRCSAHAEGSTIAIGVRDEGPGVPAEARERLFEPFESAAGGTGLGLAVSRRLVEEMDGTIRLADAPGGGALFEVRLPAAAPISVRTAQRANGMPALRPEVH